MTRHLLLVLLLAAPLAAQTETPVLELYQPEVGSDGWDAEVNQNLEDLDAYGPWWKCTVPMSVTVNQVLGIASVSGECELAQADSAASAEVYGICAKKTSSTECLVQQTGRLTSLTDDEGSALTVDQPYWLSANVAGEVTSTEPAVSVLLGRAKTTSELVLRPSIAFPSGDVSGPSSSTDECVARWDGADGDTLQDSELCGDESGGWAFKDASTPIYIGLQNTSNSDEWLVNHANSGNLVVSHSAAGTPDGAEMTVTTTGFIEMQAGFSSHQAAGGSVTPLHFSNDAGIGWELEDTSDVSLLESLSNAGERTMNFDDGDGAEFVLDRDGNLTLTGTAESAGLKMTGGSPSQGYLLSSSDGSGTASWISTATVELADLNSDEDGVAATSGHVPKADGAGGIAWGSATAAAVFSAESLASSGYVQFAENDLMVQWDSGACSSGGSNNDFATAFATNYIITGSFTNQTDGARIEFVDLDTWKCTVASGTPNAHIIAIGLGP